MQYWLLKSEPSDWSWEMRWYKSGVSRGLEFKITKHNGTQNKCATDTFGAFSGKHCVERTQKKEWENKNEPVNTLWALSQPASSVGSLSVKKRGHLQSVPERMCLWSISDVDGHTHPMTNVMESGSVWFRQPRSEILTV